MALLGDFISRILAISILLLLEGPQQVGARRVSLLRAGGYHWLWFRPLDHTIGQRVVRVARLVWQEVGAPWLATFREGVG